jgi:hypothetical protein
MSPDLSPLVFIGAMIALACALLGSLYLLITVTLTDRRLTGQRLSKLMMRPNTVRKL